MLNPFVPQSLICRDVELEQVCTLLQQDSDFVVTGVTGIGRRTLIRRAAAQVEARYLEIDFLRCRSAGQFLRFWADGLTQAFSSPTELAHMQQWSLEQPLTLDQTLPPQADNIRSVVYGARPPRLAKNGFYLRACSRCPSTWPRGSTARW